MAKYTALDVAKWVLSKQSMSYKKLQAMVFYAYSWTLVLRNKDAEHIKVKLFDEPIEAWTHGAVTPTIYNEYNKYGFYEIPKSKCDIKFSKDIENILEHVLQVYGKFSALELESIIQQQSPWKKTRVGVKPGQIGHKIINDKLIYNYYYMCSITTE